MRFNHRAAATAFRAVARTFGEGVRIEPQIASEYSDAMPDPSRSHVNARGVVALTPASASMDGARSGSGKMSTTTSFSARRAAVWFSPSAYNGIGYGVRSGDKIVLVEREGQPAYTVAREPERSDRGDVGIILVQEGSE